MVEELPQSSLPEPPPRRGSPALRELVPGRWWRVHAWDSATRRWRGNQFNTSGRGDARFSPLPDARQRSRWLSTLYAAASIEAALMETVLHDVPYPSEGHIHDLDRDLAGPLMLSAIDIREPLQFVDLTKIGLQRMGLRVPQLFETDAVDFARTRRWALWLREQAPLAQGLLWMSVRHAEQPAVLLFGDRIRRGAIVVAKSPPPRPLADPDVLARLLALLDRLGCGVAPNRG